MDDAVSVCLVPVQQRPMRRPLPRHDMLDGQFASSDALVAKSLPSVSPATLVILDGFEHHAKSPATKATIGEQRGKLFVDLRVVRPVPASTRLSRQVALDHVA